VTPKISPDGFVRMEVGTTNSSISSSSVKVTSGQQEVELPILNERRASTTVSVQSGQTIIIGGLIGTADDRRTRKMPVLGDIPVLGALFRTTHNSRERRELLILLTPQVLVNPLEAGRVRTLDEVTRDNLDRSRIKDEIQRDQLQQQLLDPLYPKKELKKDPKDPKKENPPTDGAGDIDL
jgi:type II secretory pathway component GspD/PulD (secretin)